MFYLGTFGGPAVMSRLGFRPEALRLHLSMGLLLSSDLRHHYSISHKLTDNERLQCLEGKCFSQLVW
jgi:hypothetical protein